MSIMNEKLSENPSFSVRKSGHPDPYGACVVYWMQMVLTGWMHNYLRMHWAKKNSAWADRAVFGKARYMSSITF
jgi:hypothetical protein